MTRDTVILPGQSHPLGATLCPDGVNFCVYSKHSTAMELLLFDDVDDSKPAHIFPLDPKRNRTFDYWHVLVPDIEPGQVYAYRAHGPFDPARGLRFDSELSFLVRFPAGAQTLKGFRVAQGVGFSTLRVSDLLPHFMLWTGYESFFPPGEERVSIFRIGTRVGFSWGS